MKPTKESSVPGEMCYVNANIRLTYGVGESFDVDIWLDNSNPKFYRMFKQGKIYEIYKKIGLNTAKIYEVCVEETSYWSSVTEYSWNRPAPEPEPPSHTRQYYSSQLVSMYKEFKNIVKFREDGTYFFETSGANTGHILPSLGKVISISPMTRNVWFVLFLRDNGKIFERYLRTVPEQIENPPHNIGKYDILDSKWRGVLATHKGKVIGATATLKKNIKSLLPDAIRWFHHYFGMSVIQERNPHYDKDTGKVTGYSSSVLGAIPDQKINPLVEKIRAL